MFNRNTKQNKGGRRVLALLLALLLIACVIPASVLPSARTAQAFGDPPPAPTRGEELAAEYLDGISRLLEQRYGARNLQDVLDNTERSNLLSPWYAFAFSQYDTFDFEKYAQKYFVAKSFRDSLPTYIEALRDALFNLAMGGDVSTLGTTSPVGKGGIMSFVFTLHLINNGFTPSDSSAADVIRSIFDARLADGGWAISGEYSDVDVTAMTLQALAPWRSENVVAQNGNPSEDAPTGTPSLSSKNVAVAPKTVCDETIPGLLSAEVSDVISRGIELLASRQNADAGFTSYGSPNVESSAQVLVLLSTLGIDACTDARFLKGDRSILDVFSDYRMIDGSFCHVTGGAPNETAMQQVCYACVAYLRFRDGKPGLYDLDAVRRKRDGETPQISEAPNPTGSVASPTPVPTSGADAPNPGSDNNSRSLDYRVIGSIVIAALLLILFLVLKTRKRLTRRNSFLVLILAAALLTVLWVIPVQTPEQYYASLAVSDEEAAGAVTLSIRCDTVAGLDGLPADGVLLAPVKIAFREGDTVFDALSAAAAKAHLALDIGSGGSAYIRSIGTLREFDYGTLSGWMYYVNGEAPTDSCGNHKLKDGDVIEWRYTRDMGADTEK